jgi:phosphoribosyl 1,2-cyclic phosphodiesterase
MPSRLTNLCGTGTFTVGDLKITPFKTPHDAADSVGYFIEDKEGKRLTLATDLGYVTDEIYSYMKKSDFVIIESNYDVEMPDNGPYQYHLKLRVKGQNGHLSNGDCAYIVCKLADDGVKHFLLAHLSENNNRPSLAVAEVCGALSAVGYKPGDVTVNLAPRHEPSVMFEI